MQVATGREIENPYILAGSRMIPPMEVNAISTASPYVGGLP